MWQTGILKTTQFVIKIFGISMLACCICGENKIE